MSATAAEVADDPGPQEQDPAQDPAKEQRLRPAIPADALHPLDAPRDPEQDPVREQQLRPGTLRCGCRFTVVLRREDHMSDGVEAMREHSGMCPNQPVQPPPPPPPPRPPDTPAVAVFRTILGSVFSGSTAWIIVAVGVAFALVKHGNVIFGP